MIYRVDAVGRIVEYFLFVPFILGELVVVVTPGIFPRPEDRILCLLRSFEERASLLPHTGDKLVGHAVINDLKKTPLTAGFGDFRDRLCSGLAGRILRDTTNVDDRNRVAEFA